MGQITAAGMITGSEGNIDIGTSEALYDYLVQEYFEEVCNGKINSI